MTYTIKHLHTGATFERPNIVVNERRKNGTTEQHFDPAVEALHSQLPNYGETKLHGLPSIASQLGFSHVFMKDESTRFGLPSFKILGASWAIHQAICKKLKLPKSTSLSELTKALGERNDVRIVLCTEGNWGRACARMAKYLGIPATIYVPWFMNKYTQDLLKGEGAEVRCLPHGSYDDTIAAVQDDAKRTGALIALDTSWDAYTEFPLWVKEGYSTMLQEADRQVAAETGGKTPNLCFASVGVGSWAHSVVSHYMSESSENKIVTVEPDTAACFKESLHCDKIVSVETGETIMNGMNCGTPSLVAWPVLRDGTYAAVTVTDSESHENVQFLQSKGINAGPCGAATLAALKKLCAKFDPQTRRDMIVVLFSTEGNREYNIPNE